MAATNELPSPSPWISRVQPRRSGRYDEGEGEAGCPVGGGVPWLSHGSITLPLPHQHQPRKLVNREHGCLFPCRLFHVVPVVTAMVEP